MSKLKLFLAFVAAAFVFALAPRAHATHFRYGNITYTNDVINPKIVRFDVTVAWRSSYLPVDCTSLNFGDGFSNPCTVGLALGTGIDTIGEQYTFYRYTATHTYASQSQFTAFFTSCCRLSSLVNAGDDSFRVEAKVDTTPGNSGNPLTAVPAIIQLQTGGVRTQFIPATDPDGTPVSCRFSTPAEGGDATTIMPPNAGGQVPTVGPSMNPPGCLLTWNLTAAAANQKYAVSIALESPNTINSNILSKATLDYIIELVSSPPPTCAGSGTSTLNMGDPFTKSVIGTSNSFGPTLTMTAISQVGFITPALGTMGPSPFTATLDWTPGGFSNGTHLATFIFTDQGNRSGYCSLTLVVPPCPVYGTPCTAGVGECQKNGIMKCVNGQDVCTAVAGPPKPETCNALDDDCNGTIDDNNPGAGAICMTNFPGACLPGKTSCNAGSIQCVPDVAPGSVMEVCNTVDDDCDGTVDDGFGVGNPCSQGVGACKTAGQMVCDGMGGAMCSAVAGQPKPETCNGADDDCNGQTDEGFGLGNPCTSGLGVCLTSGVTVCDAMGNPVCDAQPPTPTPEVCGNALDEDCDGATDNGCGDSDSDGIFDAIELTLRTDPNDADTDDDGVSDGAEPDLDKDTDGDGLINARDPDSDDDGLLDGTEMGHDCAGPGTDASRNHCRPDADLGATKTDPLRIDTDNGGTIDGSEDANLNGKVDPGEGDPSAAGDDAQAADTDGDGLSDALEAFLHSDPKDIDSDDDGLLDGDEANPSDDTDGDGLVTVLDCDSDDDALFDGTEAGKDCLNPSTDMALGHCRPDLDKGVTTTSQVDRDTDGDGRRDGSEDPSFNGKVDPGEGDPNNAMLGGSMPDSDSDGLSDSLELKHGLDPADVDSDDDGVIDGDEANPSDDDDGDGLINARDPDSDGDGLFDGTERGLLCNDPDTDAAKKQCVADADQGQTKTSMVNPDTDWGGATDGDEDLNHDGAVGVNERDPLNPADDPNKPECTKDADCGGAVGGVVCDTSKLTCVDGCRGKGGNGCPSGKTCTSADESIGTCKDGGGPPLPPGDDGGCACTAAGSSSGSFGPLWLALFTVGAALRRRAIKRR